jgi:hypothetical protein
MFALAEGVAAIALVGVVLSAARAARRCGHPGAGVAAAAFGIAVAAISWTQLGLGIWLISGLVPNRRAGTAGAVYQVIMRIDGAKMILLAAMALAIGQLARTRLMMPRWMAPVAVVLAVTLLMSGVGFMVLASGLASVVLVSGTILVIFVCATGITLRNPDEGDRGIDRLRHA